MGTTKNIEYINCPNCNTAYKIPLTNKTLKITCNNCGWIFYKKTKKTPPINNRKFIKPAVYLIIIIAFIYFIIDFENWEVGEKSGTIPNNKSSNWITIEYGRLIDKSILTHSGETVEDIIVRIPKYTDELKGQVQKYLEPYSILCHDVLLSTTKPDTLPLVNILAHYPEGSEQPVWAALFREGHYQVYYNSKLIRVFLKGAYPSISFEKYQSVVRLPILDILNSEHTSIRKVEVYVFKNDYASTKIELNTTPRVFTIDELDLSAHKKTIDLSSIEYFLNQGVILEAIEVDRNNDLYFYGRNSRKQTLAGDFIALSDIAVIYRSIFHYGNNSPYISLDKNEDNRFAKVNYGGNLENTHVGSVVLEADKLFKALGTGLDPNTHHLITENITKKVPDFLTEDERSLLENSGEGHTQIRYWFYPDSIGTVTDGSLGVVLTHQFLADVERMDINVRTSNAVKETINHLNKNYHQYSKAEKTFQELNTVGRIMALVNWLKGMNMDDRIELDELLAVKIPAFKTPKRTKKMLAVTAISYSGNTRLNNQNIRNYTKTYYISDLLDKYSSSTSDKYFLKVAGDYFSKIDIKDIAPSEYNKLQSTKNYYDRLIKLINSEIESLGNEIERKKHNLNKKNSRDVDLYNDKINKYNDLLATQKSYVKTYNEQVNKLNNMDIKSRCITSIGGGINLRPSEFKQISRNRNSPKLLEILEIKSKFKTVGKIAISGNWLRSNPQISKPIINLIPTNKWSFSKSINGQIKYLFQSPTGDKASVTLFPNLNKWESVISVNGNEDIVKYFKSSNQLFVSHPGFSSEFKGRVLSSGKIVEFYR